MRHSRQNNSCLAEETNVVKETKEMSKNNLEGTRKCNYIGRSKTIRDETENSCVPKEVIMKN